MKYSDLAEVPAEPVSHNPEISKRVLMRRGELPHVNQFAQATLQPGQRASAHQHVDMWEVFHGVSGTGHLYVDSQSQEIRPGVCVVVEPGERHELVNSGATEFVVLVLGVENEGEAGS